MMRSDDDGNVDGGSAEGFAFDFAVAFVFLPIAGRIFAENAPVIDHRNRLLPRKVRSCDAAALLAHLVRRTAGDDIAAESTGRGTEIEQPVGAGDHVAVVLDDQQRVTEIAEFMQRADQARVVARMKADRRFVEHIEHAAESAADLAREANPLRLAARKRRRRAADGEVLEADVAEERQPIADLANQLAGNLLLRGGELPLVDRRQQLAERQPQYSSMVRPWKRTAAESSRRRLPPHWLHSISSTRCSRRPRRRGDNRDASSRAG
jgi:hypothetical protein